LKSNTWNHPIFGIQSSSRNHPGVLPPILSVPRRKYDIGGFCNGILAGTSEPDGGHGKSVKFMGGFHQWIPIAGWFIMDNHIKIDDFGVPPFQETSIIYIYIFNIQFIYIYKLMILMVFNVLTGSLHTMNH
jgi:hypothetical protein